MSPDRLARIQAAYQRWGWWSLLLSWTPVIGDLLTLVARVMCEPCGAFYWWLVVTLAEATRYGLVWGLTLSWR